MSSRRFHHSTTGSAGIGHWAALGRNPAGQLLEESYGNGARTSRTYESWVAPPTDISTSVVSRDVIPTITPVQDLHYHYDVKENVDVRQEHVFGWEDGFEYDLMGRLDSWQDSGPAGTTSHDFEYDRLGNLTLNKGTDQHYGERDNGPQAITSAATDTFHYDDNGRLVQGRGREIDYTSFDLPRTVHYDGGSGETRYKYDAGHERVEKRSPDATTVYAGKLYKRVTDATGTQHIFNLPAAGRVVAQVRWNPASGERETYYVHPDELGSAQTVTDGSGTIAASFRYRPFGSRDLIGGSEARSQEFTLGFTGHSHDDREGMINMQGRMFDPEIGRFLTPDPLGLGLDSSQGLNRYSYVRNNPLRFTDPSGFDLCDAGLEGGSNCPKFYREHPEYGGPPRGNWGVAQPSFVAWAPGPALGPTPGNGDSSGYSAPGLRTTNRREEYNTTATTANGPTVTRTEYDLDLVIANSLSSGPVSTGLVAAGDVASGGLTAYARQHAPGGDPIDSGTFGYEFGSASYLALELVATGGASGAVGSSEAPLFSRGWASLTRLFGEEWATFRRLLVDQAGSATSWFAARALPAVSRVARLTQEGAEHIALRHFPTSEAARAGRFATTSLRELRALITEAVERGAVRPNTLNRPGVVFEYDFGRQIGIDIAGHATTRLRVVVTPQGLVKTAFPF